MLQNTCKSRTLVDILMEKNTTESQCSNTFISRMCILENKESQDTKTFKTRVPVH